MTSSQRVVQRYLEAAKIKTRELGTCGFCDREIKIPGGKLAHHGFQRPGYGYITGSCPGTGYEPFEVSPKTAEVGLEMAEARVTTLTQILKELDNVDVLEVRGYGGRGVKEIRKSEIPAPRWELLLREEIRGRQFSLKEAERMLSAFQVKVRNWKPQEVKTVDEVVQQKQRQQEKAREARMVRYKTNQGKLVDRLKKAFAKLQRAESGLKSEHKNPKKIAKYLKESASAAYVIYSAMGGAPDKLSKNFPGYIERDDIIADLQIDDILKHMGAIKGPGKYISVRESNQMEHQAFQGNEDEIGYIKSGLDQWVPFWPGWKGVIHYPEGTTGENWDRNSWPK